MQIGNISFTVVFKNRFRARAGRNTCTTV